MAEVHPFERRQAVSVTLENCYDDWCVAQMAKALKKDDDYAYFMKRAHNYANVFDGRIGMMAPKTADGQWVESFDPRGEAARAGATICRVQLLGLHLARTARRGRPDGADGRREQFAAKLDQLFVEQYGTSKYAFLGQFPDMTGLIGNYAQGDEPSFHIPYLYNYCGQPWKAQRLLRQIMEVWYGDGPLGICGDEDGGAMSSWYVLSAMGFYPVCPGRPVYDIGSPLFQEVKIALAGGRTFTVSAPGASAGNKYVQSATLNGKPLDKPWFTHDELAARGDAGAADGSAPEQEMGKFSRKRLRRPCRRGRGGVRVLVTGITG